MNPKAKKLAVKACGFTLLWGLLAWLTWQTTVLEPDLIKALTDDDPRREQLFTAYQAKNPFAQKLFIHSAGPLPEPVTAQLAKAGYRPDGLSPALDKPLWWYLALLPKGKLTELLRPGALTAAAQDAAAQIARPGGSMALAAMAADPFAIKRTALSRLHSAIFAGSSPSDAAAKPSEPAGQVLSYSRPAPPAQGEKAQGEEAQGAEQLLPLYQELKRHDSLTAIAGEFFTLENTRAVKGDMELGFTLATLANIALFIWLCPSLTMVAFLLVGTSLSYLAGLLLLNLSFPYVFTITLAFTSTFASFNNEYLVHLSGLDGDRRQRMARGLVAAIGTTLIIFILLAFSSSVLIQQVAIISIGGMAAFIGLLLAFPELLSQVQYRDIRLPFCSLSRQGQQWLCLSAWLAAAAGLSLLTAKTDIGDFRFESPYLSQSRAMFEQLRAASFGRSPVALPADVLLDLEPSKEHHGGQPLAGHPAALLAPRDITAARLKAYRATETAAAQQLTAALASRGLRLPTPASPGPSQPYSTVPGPQNYRLAGLRIIDAVTPLPYLLTTAGTKPHGPATYVVAYLGAAEKKPPGAIALSPKGHYDSILTAAAADMMTLFAIGFGVIAGFLGVMQRSRVFYILTPLALALIALTALLWHQGRAINFIHLLGFSLVLAVALDYGTIAIASGFHPTERSKILFTGLSTTLTFGILCLAEHPVLIDLGTTVALGSAAALSYALFVRVPSS